MSDTFDTKDAAFEGAQKVHDALIAAQKKAACWLVVMPMLRFKKAEDGTRVIERTGDEVRYGPFHDKGEAQYWASQNSDGQEEIIEMIDIRIFEEEMNTFHRREAEQRKYNRLMQNG